MEENVTCQGCAHGHAQPADRAETAARAESALAQARGLDRRELLKKGGRAAAAAMLLSACGGALGSDITGPGLGGSFTVKISDNPALASAGGVAAVVSPGGIPIYVENTGSGYIALSRICPHQGGQINAFSNSFQCQVHGATFDRNGTWIGGQPTGNMAKFTVTDSGNGTLTIS